MCLPNSAPKLGVRGEEADDGLDLEISLEVLLADLLALGEELVAEVGVAEAALVSERVDVTVDLRLALEEQTGGGEDLPGVAGGEGGVEKSACGVECHKELVTTSRFLESRPALRGGEGGLGRVSLLVTMDLMRGERELPREFEVGGRGGEGGVDFRGSGVIT